MKTALLLIGLVAAVLVVGYVDKPVSNADMVYKVCNESRMQPVTDKDSEAYCGQLQDTYKYEFLCERYSPDVDNHCWVEHKTKDWEGKL